MFPKVFSPLLAFFGFLDLFQRYGYHIGRFDEGTGVLARFQDDMTAGDDGSGCHWSASSCSTGIARLKLSRSDLLNSRKGSEYLNSSRPGSDQNRPGSESPWFRFALAQSRPGSESPWLRIALFLSRQNSWNSRNSAENRIFFVIYSLKTKCAYL